MCTPCKTKTTKENISYTTERNGPSSDEHWPLYRHIHTPVHIYTHFTTNDVDRVWVAGASWFTAPWEALKDRKGKSHDHAFKLRVLNISRVLLNVLRQNDNTLPPKRSEGKSQLHFNRILKEREHWLSRAIQTPTQVCCTRCLKMSYFCQQFF